MIFKYKIFNLVNKELITYPHTIVQSYNDTEDVCDSEFCCAVQIKSNDVMVNDDDVVAAAAMPTTLILWLRSILSCRDWMHTHTHVLNVCVAYTGGVVNKLYTYAGLCTILPTT